MKLALPNLTVIDRGVPYGFTHVEIPIFEGDAARARQAGQFDLLQANTYVTGPRRQRERARTARGEEARERLDRIIQIDIGSRFILPPGDPSPWVWRHPGPVDCGALSGVAAVYCAVMSRR
jgi:hypothetical protein